MKSLERLSRSLHVTGALAETPVKGAQVRDAHVALEQATAELTHARLAYERRNDAVRDCSARVRDATRLTSAECKKGRGVLVGEGVVLAPHATDSGSTTHAVLARADFLLERAGASGVKLAALSSRRPELRGAYVAWSTARAAKHAASVVHQEARDAWDSAYAALRATVEGELRHEGLKSADLKQRLASYFPPRLAHRSTAPAPASIASPAPRPEDGKPAA